MRDKFDDLLREALIPSEKPDAMLTQQILQKAGGEDEMRKPKFKMAPAIGVVAAILLASGSLSAYAAWQYLSVEQVAENVGDKNLAEAFRGKGAVSINESQSYGDYKITLLGTVTGKNLSSYVNKDDNGEIQSDKTYAVIAIKKRDGSAMPDSDAEEQDNASFLVSPFIKGEDPVHMNIYYMNGGKSSFVKDGISYHVVECDNLESFAKRGVYLGVLNTMFYDKEAYHFDKKTGDISRNEKYNGVNALFDLPLDESKADEKVAEEQLAKWLEEAEADESEDEVVTKKGKEWTVEEIKEKCTLRKDLVKTYPASKFDELIPISVSFSHDKGEASGEFRPSGYFKKNEYGIKCIGMSGGGEEETDVFDIYELCERHKDGTLTVYIYEYNK